MAVALAHSRGLINYDEKVATYWPEFAQNGKENVTVRQRLSYQAGLCAIDEPLDLGKIADPDFMVGYWLNRNRSESQAPSRATMPFRMAGIKAN